MYKNGVRIALVWLAATALALSWVYPVFATSSYSYPAYNSMDVSPSNGSCNAVYIGATQVGQYCVSGSASNGKADVDAWTASSDQSFYAHTYFDNSQYATGAPSVYESSGIYCCVSPEIGLDSLGPVQVTSGTADSAIDTIYYVYHCPGTSCTNPTENTYLTVLWDSWSQGNVVFGCSSCGYSFGLYSDAAGTYWNAGGVKVGAGDAGSGAAVADFEFTNGQCPCYYATIANLGISG